MKFAEQLRNKITEANITVDEDDGFITFHTF